MACGWLITRNSGALNHRMVGSVHHVVHAWRSEIKYFVGWPDFCQFMNQFYKHNRIYDSIQASNRTSVGEYIG